MKRTAMLVCAGAVWLAADGALGQTCEERIIELEEKLDEAAAYSISASSGGQGVAGSREAQAMELVEEGEEIDEPVVPYQEDAEEAEAVERAEEAGEAGDFVLQARALVEQARAHAQDDDEAGCEEAITDAAELLDEYRLGTEKRGVTSEEKSTKAGGEGGAASR